MKRSMGSLDRAVRILLALVIQGLFFTNVLSGILAVVLVTLSAVFVLTSLFGFCPLYLPFGITTCKKK
jgi:hypothetical protein